MNGPGPGAHQSGLVAGFYTARYIVGMFVTVFPNEAHLIEGECPIFRIWWLLTLTIRLRRAIPKR
jgi:hypothetical protein